MIWERIQNRIKLLRWSARSWVKQQLVANAETFRSFGTSYAPGTVAERDGLKGGLAVLCGAGEDISFDLELQRRYGCEIVIVDPTPRAIQHVREVVQAGKAGKPNQRFVINKIPVSYDLTGIDFEKIELVPYGIWNEHTTLRFFAPKDPAHVSYSITNLQETREFIEVEVRRLDEITSKPIALMKLNIEGAEIEVLLWLAESTIRPEQIFVVFDELHTPTAQSPERIRQAVTALHGAGYRLVHFDGFSGCLFLHAG